MLKEIWEVHVIGTNENDLFEAIITAEDCSKLIAQVAKVETANDIVSLHNNERGLTPRAADGQTVPVPNDEPDIQELIDDKIVDILARR